MIELRAGFLTGDPRIGTLSILHTHGKETLAFSLDKNWLLEHPDLVLDPELAMYSGIQYPTRPSGFGFLSDSMPDRWGRRLIQREERMKAQEEQRAHRTLSESAYLLGLSDPLRYGGIRLYDTESQVYLTEGSHIPPIASLRTLESASREYELSPEDKESLQILLEPGSSLGGARPKSNVRDTDGSLWIAKFPSRKDDRDIGAWEMVEHDLAEACGIQVPPAKLLHLSGHGSTFLVKRFDRNGASRVHAMSAMTALIKSDGEDASYLEFAEILESLSADPETDLRELWLRIAFSVLTSNCDDHLRNHSLILDTEEKWHLSPAYDLNPSLEKDHLALSITDQDSTKDIRLVLSVADWFRLTEEDAIQKIQRMQKTIQTILPRLTAKYRIPESEVHEMEPAFSECTRSIS